MLLFVKSEVCVRKKQSFFEKVWAQNLISNVGENYDMLHVDRNFIHDLSGARALTSIQDKRAQVKHPHLTFAAPDHTVLTQPGIEQYGDRYDHCIKPLRQYSEDQKIKYFDYKDSKLSYFLLF